MTLHIGMLVFPNLTQLDLTGPLELFHRVPGAQVHLVWKDRQPVRSNCHVVFEPTTTTTECPALDVIFVPGGYGHIELLRDRSVLDFLATQAQHAKYVTSVCTGSLLLGAAGLLEGYEATTHWAYLDVLSAFGARPVSRRVVIDRNRITAGGVTAGLDFGFAMVAQLAGEETAKAIQLGLEYDPEPPFRQGHPSVAAPALVEQLRARFAASLARTRSEVAQWSTERR